MVDVWYGRCICRYCMVDVWYGRCICRYCMVDVWYGRYIFRYCMVDVWYGRCICRYCMVEKTSLCHSTGNTTHTHTHSHYTLIVGLKVLRNIIISQRSAPMNFPAADRQATVTLKVWIKNVIPNGEMSAVKIQMQQYEKRLCFLLMCAIIAVLGTHTKTTLLKGIGVCVLCKCKGSGEGTEPNLRH